MEDAGEAAGQPSRGRSGAVYTSTAMDIRHSQGKSSSSMDMLAKWTPVERRLPGTESLLDSAGSRPELASGSSGRSRSAVEYWDEPHIREKFGFLEIAPPMSTTAEGIQEQRKTISDPTSSRSSSSQRSKGSSSNDEQVKSLNAIYFPPGIHPGDGGGKTPDEPQSSYTDDVQHRPSLGSIWHLHQAGKCKPCTYVKMGCGCLKGKACIACHYSHEDTGLHRLKPCKRKREQFKAFEQKIRARILQDPFGFQVCREKFPNFITKDERQVEKCIKTLAEYQKQVQSSQQRYQNASQPSNQMRPGIVSL